MTVAIEPGSGIDYRSVLYQREINRLRQAQLDAAEALSAVQLQLRESEECRDAAERLRREAQAEAEALIALQRSRTIQHEEDCAALGRRLADLRQQRELDEAAASVAASAINQLRKERSDLEAESDAKRQRFADELARLDAQAREARAAAAEASRAREQALADLGQAQGQLESVRQEIGAERFRLAAQKEQLDSRDRDLRIYTARLKKRWAEISPDKPLILLDDYGPAE